MLGVFAHSSTRSDLSRVKVELKTNQNTSQLLALAMTSLCWLFRPPDRVSILDTPWSSGMFQAFVQAVLYLLPMHDD